MTRMICRAGTPNISEYLAMLESTALGEIQNYSDSFLKAIEESLRPHSRKWVADPLHQWSR